MRKVSRLQSLSLTKRGKYLVVICEACQCIVVRTEKRFGIEKTRWWAKEVDAHVETEGHNNCMAVARLA